MKNNNPLKNITVNIFEQSLKENLEEDNILEIEARFMDILGI